jgi:hypothetical protein
MKEDDIIEIIKELLNDEILVAISDDPFCGATIEGKEEFFNKLKIKLKELFKNKNLK